MSYRYDNTTSAGYSWWFNSLVIGTCSACAHKTQIYTETFIGAFGMCYSFNFISWDRMTSLRSLLFWEQTLPPQHENYSMVSTNCMSLSGMWQHAVSMKYWTVTIRYSAQTTELWPPDNQLGHSVTGVQYLYVLSIPVETLWGKPEWAPY